MGEIQKLPSSEQVSYFIDLNFVNDTFTKLTNLYQRLPNIENIGALERINENVKGLLRRLKVIEEKNYQTEKITDLLSETISLAEIILHEIEQKIKDLTIEFPEEELPPIEFEEENLPKIKEHEFTEEEQQDFQQIRATKILAQDLLDKVINNPSDYSNFENLQLTRNAKEKTFEIMNKYEEEDVVFQNAVELVTILNQIEDLLQSKTLI